MVLLSTCHNEQLNKITDHQCICFFLTSLYYSLSCICMDSSYDFALGVIIIEHWKCTQGTFRANSTNSVYSVCVIVSNFCLEKKVFLEIRHLVKPLLFLLIYAKRFCWVVVAVGKLLRQTQNQLTDIDWLISAAPLTAVLKAAASNTVDVTFEGLSFMMLILMSFDFDVSVLVPVVFLCSCFCRCLVSLSGEINDQ